MTAIIVLLFHILGFVSSINAVMSARTAQGSIAWAVSLNTFPYIAVPAYWILGRSKFEGYVVARRQADRENDPVRQELVESLEPFQVHPEDSPGPILAAQRLAGLPVLRGNQVDLLIDGEATFESILSGIDKAEDYVLVQFYIVRDDDLGRQLRDRLLASAARGVRVYFLYDEIGSHQLPRDYLRQLRDGGVEIEAFNSRKGISNRFQINFRNHRKIVVVDGLVSWIGGHNVGDEYLGKDPRFGNWRDTHVRIEGPATMEAQVSFVEDWFWATDAFPDLRWTATPSASGGDSEVLVIPTGPADEMETASLMFVHAISSARDRVWIATPYFVPDAAVLGALQLAALKGVDVRILIPETPDSMLVYLAAYSYFHEISKTGARFYRFDDGFLHEKAMLIDDEVAAIGTANFDNRSFRLNFEVTAVITDEDFGRQVEQMFEDDFEHARLMAPDEYAQKPWWFRFGVRLSRLTAPIL